LPADEEFDEFLGIGTGAAALFGTTGGVMEAALRCAALCCAVVWTVTFALQGVAPLVSANPGG